MRSIVTAFLISATAASASININWGSSAGSAFIPAAAPPVTGAPQQYFFLGAFEPGFTPTADNRSEWLANWTMVGSQRLFSGGFFNQASVLESNSGATAIGAPAYIWGVSGNEWVLLNSALWTWPNANSPINPITPSFQISRVTTEATFGTISDDGNEVTFAVSNNADAPSVTADRFLELFDQDDFTEDPDQDGLTNLEEFALAGSPISAASRPSILIEPIGDDYQMTFPKGTLDRVNFGIQRSENVTQFTGGVPFTFSRFSNRDLVIVAGGAQRQFYRALYTLPN